MYRHVVGGKTGHWLRRLIHVAMVCIPWLYYSFAGGVAKTIHLRVQELLGVVLICILIMEILRLKMGWVILGQRQNEAKRISALAWGGMSICVVFLCVPGGYESGIRYALPLVATLSFIDPVMGELRYRKVSTAFILASGWIVAALIWGLACYVYQLSVVYFIVLPLLSVVAEQPNVKWLDDNALVLLLPLLFIVLTQAWL
jgi:hypothetical protein